MKAHIIFEIIDDKVCNYYTWPLYERICLLFHHRKTFKCHVSLDQTPQIQWNIFHTVTLPSYEVDLQIILKRVFIMATINGYR